MFKLAEFCLSDYIESLPLANTPEVFGLHPNAEIGYYTQAARNMWSHLVELQPQTGETGAGISREEFIDKVWLQTINAGYAVVVGYIVHSAKALVEHYHIKTSLWVQWVISYDRDTLVWQSAGQFLQYLWNRHLKPTIILGFLGLILIL